MNFRCRLSDDFSATKRAFDADWCTRVLFELSIIQHLVLLRTPVGCTLDGNLVDETHVQEMGLFKAVLAAALGALVPNFAGGTDYG